MPSPSTPKNEQTSVLRFGGDGEEKSATFSNFGLCCLEWAANRILYKAVGGALLNKHYDMLAS